MRVLIVSQGNWQGPARIPRALKQAGWEVAAICRKGELISQTRFVDRFFFTDTADEASVLRAMHQVCLEWQPDLILPGTDNIVETAQKFRLMSESGQIDLPEQVRAAVTASTFPHRSEKFLVSKIDLLDALKEKGVRTAPQKELVTMSDAEQFVAEHGYPVVLKPDQGFAGSGIVFCNDEDELIEGLRKILFAIPRRRYAIQKFLGRKTALIEFVAKDGELLAANSVLRLRTHPGDTGPTSVARVVRSYEMLDAAKAAVELLGYNGLGIAQFMVEDETCETAHLIELNPRMSSFVHLWRLMGTDLTVALREAWSGQRVTIQPPRVDVTIALYPQETLRDPNSEFLQGMRDKVEDDPDLLASYEETIRQKSTSDQIASR